MLRIEHLYFTRILAFRLACNPSSTLFLFTISTCLCQKCYRTAHEQEYLSVGAVMLMIFHWLNDKYVRRS